MPVGRGRVLGEFPNGRAVVYVAADRSCVCADETDMLFRMKDKIPQADRTLMAAVRC